MTEDQNSGIDKSSSSDKHLSLETNPNSSASSYLWMQVVGAFMGFMTLGFFMLLVLAALLGFEVPSGSRPLIVIVFSLGTALAFGFMGGSASAKGTLPIPLLNKSPLRVALGGGVAVFVIAFALGMALYGNPNINGNDNTELSIDPSISTIDFQKHNCQAFDARIDINSQEKSVTNKKTDIAFCAKLPDEEDYINEPIAIKYGVFLSNRQITLEKIPFPQDINVSKNAKIEIAASFHKSKAISKAIDIPHTCRNLHSQKIVAHTSFILPCAIGNKGNVSNHHQSY